MLEYHKIQSIFKRDLNGKFTSEYSRPEFKYLRDNDWIYTEKVDGTNIRIMYDGENLKFGGKTDNAQTPMDLINRLSELFKPEMFINFPEGVCLYGEGFGAGIQKGGCYSPTKDFVLFDIKIGNWWLQRGDVELIAKDMKIQIVPIIGIGTLGEAIERTKTGFKSQWGDFIAEGIVLRPRIELIARNGQRIITKVKYKDFK